MSKVTPTQQRVLDAIAAHWQAKGYAPSFREIGHALGITSTNGVSYHVQALVKKGLLMQDRGIIRSLRLAKAVAESGLSLEDVPVCPSCGGPRVVEFDARGVH